MKYPDGLDGYFRYTIRKEESRLPLHGVYRLLFALRVPFRLSRVFDIKQLVIFGRPTFSKDGVRDRESKTKVRPRVSRMQRQLVARYSPLLKPDIHGYRDREDAAILYGKIDFGYIGSTVTGNLFVLLLIDRGVTVATYFNILQDLKNRLIKESTTFFNELNIHGRIYERLTVEHLEEKVRVVQTLEEMVEVVKGPRKIMLAIKDRDHANRIMMKLISLIHPDGAVIDISDSKYRDTSQRNAIMKRQGMLFLPCGVKLAAHYGFAPFCIMVGGTEEAWPGIKKNFRSVSRTLENVSCCNYIGVGASGQLAKMLLDGIEHMERQMIAEAYLMLKNGLGLSHPEMSKIFEDWGNDLNCSFFLKATSEILGCYYKLTKEEEDERRRTRIYPDWYNWPLLALIRVLDKDELHQTENIAVCYSAATDLGGPLSILNAVASVRFMPTWRTLAHDAEAYVKVPSKTYDGDKDEFINHVCQALFVSRSMVYTQSLLMIKETARQYGWKLNYGTIVHSWRGYPCLRSQMICKLQAAFDHNPGLLSVVNADFFALNLNKFERSLRHVVITAIKLKIPIPAFTAAMAFYDGVRTDPLPTSLAEAVRNYLGYDDLYVTQCGNAKLEMDWLSKIPPDWLSRIDS